MACVTHISPPLRPPLPLALLAIAASAYLWAVFITTFAQPGTLGWNFNTPGNDFMVFHAAVIEALHGQIALINDIDRLTALMNARYASLLSYPLVFRPWVNPPGMLVLLLPFAAMPFQAAYALFEIVTAGALLLAIRARAGSGARAGATLIALATLVSPAAAFNVVCGQAAFLTAALLIGGTRLLPRHPMWGGIVLGLLSVKPQHAVLVPVVFLAMRNARAAAAACLSAALLALTAWALFGTQAWTGWLSLTAQNLAGTDPRWFDHNQLWDSSVQTCAYLLGASRHGAALIALLAAMASAAAVYAAFRSDRPYSQKMAILLAATTLAAPHTGPYDLVLLVAASAYFILGRSAHPAWTWALACGLWLLPALHQPVVSPPARLGPVLAALLIIAILQMHRPIKTGFAARGPNGSRAEPLP